MRVCAENLWNTCGVAARSRPRSWNFCLASTTIERPSGVSSASEASCAASASSCSLTPGAGTNANACRSPSVIVPVLSSSSTSTSPAASTARPEVAMTLARTMRSMPAMPIADSSAPIVVGIRHTSSAIEHRQRDDRALAGGVHRELRERRERRGREQEHERHHREQDRQRDLVRRPAALGAFDHRDHAIEEAFAFAGWSRARRSSPTARACRR